jgi:hypothetical protein
VAPLGSVLPADLAAVPLEVAAAVPLAAAPPAAAPLVVLAVLVDPLLPVLLVDALPPFFCTPPWCEQAPLPVLVEVLPSAQVTEPVAPDVAAAGAAAPADAVDPPSFLTPPWCEQAPLPVLVDVVPSEHVTGPELVSALAGSQAKTSSSAADVSVSFFMVRFPLSATQLAPVHSGSPGSAVSAGAAPA